MGARETGDSLSWPWEGLGSHQEEVLCAITTMGDFPYPRRSPKPVCTTYDSEDTVNNKLSAMLSQVRDVIHPEYTNTTLA